MPLSFRRYAYAAFVVLVVTCSSALLGMWFRRLGMPAASTYLNDFVVGGTAALLAFVAMELTAERLLHELSVPALKQDAVLEERGRIAREIHDTLGQTLSAIAIQLEVARSLPGESPQAREAVGRALALARQGLADARTSLLNLRPDALAESDLPHAVERLAERLTRDVPIGLHFASRGRITRLPSTIEIGLLRVAGEAITNAVRHAGARNLYIELAVEESQVQLWVQDDGRGFAPQEAARSSGFGLTGMRERVEALGGICRVHSARGHGVQVQAQVPLSAAQT